MTMDSDFMTACEAADFIGMKLMDFLQEYSIGKIPYVGTPGLNLFSKIELKEWLHQKTILK